MKKNIKPKWHKEWDKRYGKFLKEPTFMIGNKVTETFNDRAKNFIENLLTENTKELFNKHNLLAFSYERLDSLNKRKIDIVKIINGNIATADEIKKDLIDLLKKV